MSAVLATKPVAVKLDEDLRARLKKLAEARQRTPHWLMKEAIAEYVERQEKRAAYVESALAAAAEYDATGLHTTFEEVDAWLARLEAGEDVEPPTPHH